VGRILSRGISVVVAECGIDGTWEKLGHHMVDRGFGILNIGTGKFVTRIVADEVL